jgi:ABC-type nickel/cobalt efflux system permease component RcnA
VSRLVRLVVASLVLLAVPAVVPAPASAHPLGNFTINHYVAVTASPTALDVELVTDYAEIPSIELLARLDANGDDGLDPSEADAARRDQCASAADALTVALDGAAVALELQAAGINQAEGAGGLATMRVVCELRASVDLAAGGSLVIDFNPDADRIGWREIVVRGDELRVDPAGAARDVSRRLTDYPDRLLEQPLDERTLTVSLLPGGEALAVAPVQDAQPLDGSAPAPEAAAGLPDLANLGAGAALLGLLAAALAGAGHALSPGHGKTVMAAYLVASHGGARHALLLGAAVTVSHTLGVLLLAAIVLLGSDVLPPERLYPVLTVASGLAVTGIGAWLLVGCLRRYRARRAHDHAHAHGHAHDHGHEHGPAAQGELPGVRGLIAIGAAGGLVPSSAALVLLLAAISAGQPAYGLAVAVAFGLGMAVVLSGIGLAIVRGRERLASWRGLGGGTTLARVSALAPWVMAATVLVGGVILTGQAFVTRL